MICGRPADRDATVVGGRRQGPRKQWTTWVNTNLGGPMGPSVPARRLPRGTVTLSDDRSDHGLANPSWSRDFRSSATAVARYWSDGRRFFTQTREAKLRGGPTTDLDVIAAAARTVLEKFELTRPVRLLGVRADLDEISRS